MSGTSPPRGDRASYVSANEVAERAGVSRSAVSRTFSGAGSVAPATRRKVLKAAEELGYHANLLARGLVGEPSKIVCLIAADVGQPYHAVMIDKVTRQLQEHGKVSMIINTSGDEESVSQALRQSLQYRAEASVVLSGSPSAKLVQSCLANGQRVVLVNRSDDAEGVERLWIDNRKACREAFALLRRAGCVRLACVSSQARTPSMITRESAFMEAAAELGVQVDVSRIGPTNYDTGLEAARVLLGRSEPPDGVFCVTDLLAFGFMDGARNIFGVDIPGDLCVIGFDDVPQARWSAYELTTFRQPMDEMAGRIAEILTSESGGSLSAFEALPVWRKTVRMG